MPYQRHICRNCCISISGSLDIKLWNTINYHYRPWSPFPIRLTSGIYYMSGCEQHQNNSLSSRSEWSVWKIAPPTGMLTDVIGWYNEVERRNITCAPWNTFNNQRSYRLHISWTSLWYNRKHYQDNLSTHTHPSHFASRLLQTMQQLKAMPPHKHSRRQTISIDRIKTGFCHDQLDNKNTNMNKQSLPFITTKSREDTNSISTASCLTPLRQNC